MNMAIIEVQSLCKNYQMGKITVHAVDNANFSIEQGEFALGYYFQRSHKKDNETTEDTNS